MRLRGPAVRTRDVLVRVYTYSDAGSSGKISPRYTFSTEVWASVEGAQMTENSVGIAPQHDVTATFGFHEGVTVSVHAVIKIVDGGWLYRVTGVSDGRTLVPGRIRRVQAVRADREAITLVGD